MTNNIQIIKDLNLNIIREYKSGLTIAAAKNLLVISCNDCSISWENNVEYPGITALLADIIDATGITINELMLELEKL